MPGVCYSCGMLLLLQLKDPVAMMLLHRNHWNVSSVVTQYREDPVQMYVRAKLYDSVDRTQQVNLYISVNDPLFYVCSVNNEMNTVPFSI